MGGYGAGILASIVKAAGALTAVASVIAALAKLKAAGGALTAVPSAVLAALAKLKA